MWGESAYCVGGQSELERRGVSGCHLGGHWAVMFNCIKNLMLRTEGLDVINIPLHMDIREFGYSPPTTWENPCWQGLSAAQMSPYASVRH